jgi:subtilisin family serine protease
VAGGTRVFAVRVTSTGEITLEDLVRGILLSIRSGARIVNMSLAGGFSPSQARALTIAYLQSVLPIAAAGNRGDDDNAIEYPAAAIGGRGGRRGIGLSVAAIKPDGQPAPFSSHNQFVTVAAPGAQGSCRFGVFSTIPRNASQIFDAPDACPRTFSGGGGRWAYGQGTSFAAPIAAGIAAVVWQVEPRLESDQVADVLARTARQTVPGPRWNEFTGTGVVDGGAAVTLARTYDITAPVVHVRKRRHGQRLDVRLGRSLDRTAPGRELAGGVDYSLVDTIRGSTRARFLVRPRRKPFRKRVRLGRRVTRVSAVVCDRVANCAVKRLAGKRP